MYAVLLESIFWPIFLFSFVCLNHFIIYDISYIIEFWFLVIHISNAMNYDRTCHQLWHWCTPFEALKNFLHMKYSNYQSKMKVDSSTTPEISQKSVSFFLRSVNNIVQQIDVKKGQRYGQSLITSMAARLKTSKKSFIVQFLCKKSQSWCPWQSLKQDSLSTYNGKNSKKEMTNRESGSHKKRRWKK